MLVQMSESTSLVQLTGSVGELVAIVGIKVPSFDVTVHEALLFSRQQSALLHAHEAAVCALGHSGDGDLHVSFFGHVPHQRWHVKR